MKRIAFLDYLRVFACFLVMVVHASENYYGVIPGAVSDMAGPQSYLMNEADRLWVSVYDGFSRMSVPLFIIISAFLLVPMKEEQTAWQFYRRRFTRILPGFILFMILYSSLPMLWGQIDWTVARNDLSRLLLNFPSTAGHLWFMYPYLNRWAGEVWGQCFWNEFHVLWYFSGYLGYVIMAHYIKVHLDWSRKKRLVAGSALMVVGAVITILSFYVQATPGVVLETPVLEVGWNMCTINCVMLTAGTFLLFTCIRQDNPPRVVADMSRLSYLVYLMHVMWLGLWVSVFKDTLALPTAAAIPAISVCTFISCFVTAKIISYIPGSKWLV